MRKKFDRLYNFIHKTVGSKGFAVFLIVLFVLQSIWIAISYRYPMLYDEAFHLDAIKLYSQQLSPIITNQPTYYDMYGSFAHGAATLYHYLMSFPYRFVIVFTNNFATQVIFLRLINIAMVATGLSLFIKLFKKIGIKQVFVNIGMLIFILLPIIPFVSATVNYDNLLFPLTALFFITCIDIIFEKRVSLSQCVWLIIIGCTASVVKYTFLPVFAIGVIYLVAVMYRRHDLHILSKIRVTLNSKKKFKKAGLAFILVLSLGMFSVIYLQNIIVYKTLQPNCEQIMSRERCSNNLMSIRNDTAEATKSTRPLMQMPSYISDWTIQMVDWTNMTGSHPAGGGTVVTQPLPIIYTTIFMGIFVGMAALLYSWRSLKKNPAWYFLIVISVGLILIVFMQNYLMYIKLHMPYAIQPRYLLTIAPIMIVMSVVAIDFILRKSKFAKFIIFVIVFLLLSQGGGVVTHILRSQDNWYWKNTTLRKVNSTTRSILEPIVKEH